MIDTRRHGSVLTICLNRPAASNALDMEGWAALIDAVDRVEADSSVRVVVLTGAGERAFMAGADIKELYSVAQDEELQRTYMELVERAMSRVATVRQPVIARLNGSAVGGGLELANVCDLVVSVSSARFGIPAAKLGLAITGQDLRRLERRIGVGHARWLLMTGELIDASTALKWGLIDAVCGAADLDETVEALVARLLANSPTSLSLLKRGFLATGGDIDYEEGLALSAPAWRSAEFHEGVSAALERRPAEFGKR